MPSIPPEVQGPPFPATAAVRQPQEQACRPGFGLVGIKLSRACYYVSPLAVQGTEPMEISVSPLTYQARKRLTCRWRLVAGSRGNIVVDMAGVDFIASIGIRHLVMAAKTVARKSGILVLLDPNPTVTEVCSPPDCRIYYRSCDRKTRLAPCWRARPLPEQAADSPIESERLPSVQTTPIAANVSALEPSAFGRSGGSVLPVSM